MRPATFHVAIVSIVILGGIAFSLPAAPAQPGAGPTGAGGPLGGNDAASGGDAGNSPQEALRIGQARRTWNANLTPPGTDADWYVLDASSAFCAVLDATTNAPGQVTLATSALLDDRASREAEPHRASRLAIAGAPGESAYFGLEPPMFMAMSGVERGNTPSPGRYTFSLETRTYADLDPQDDGESPEAGSTVATAGALAGDCLAGRIGVGDLSDAWAFDVTEPRDLTLSFVVARGDAARARIVTPAGATFATLSSGDALDVWADEPGRWTLVVERAPVGPSLLLASQTTTTATDYIIGIAEGPPGDPAPCRPSCLG